MLAPGLYLVHQNSDELQTNSLAQAECVAGHVTERNVYLEEECLEKFTKDNNYAFSYVDTDTSKIWYS